MNVPRYLNFEELSAAHDKLRVEYNRTRAIVDLLVKKFEGHVHSGGSGMLGVTTGKTMIVDASLNVCCDCGKALQEHEKTVCDKCIPF